MSKNSQAKQSPQKKQPQAKQEQAPMMTMGEIPQGDQEKTPTSKAAFSGGSFQVGTIDNPLASKTQEALPEQLQQEIEAPANPEASAAILTSVTSAACNWVWKEPLSETESAALRADLLPILIKYDVPDVPLAEEFKLALTLTEIVMNRMKKAKEETRENDNASTGQEGNGKERTNKETSMGANGYGNEAAFLVS